VTADTDLDDFIAALPQRSTREIFAEIDAARRAAETRTPQQTIIPEPVLPPLWPHPDSGIVRFPCALACGWEHPEDAYALDSEPISFPLHAGAEEMGRVLNERAEQRSAALRARVETAVRTHFAQAHPGQEPPERTVR
jgi:hypothetical protein